MKIAICFSGIVRGKVGRNIEHIKNEIPNNTNKNVATKLCKAFLPISLNVLSANLHPTEEPKINKQ